MGGKGGSPSGPVGAGTRREVEGAADAERPGVEDVGIDHRGPDIVVAEEFLDGADVLAGFEEVRCEAVAQRLNTLLIPRLQ